MYGEEKYAEIVLLEVNLNKTFHYCVPENLRDDISIGARVLIPFKNKMATGCVVGFLQKTNIKNLKSVSQLVDTKPLLTSDIIKLTQWISNYYICSWGKTLNYVIPKTRKIWLKNSEKIEKSPLNPQLSKDYNISDSDKENNFLKEEKKFQTVLFRSDNFTERVQIYFKYIQTVLGKGKQTIILAPTESHLSELAKLLEKEFKGNVVVFGEKIDQKAKYFQWIKIRNSQANIALGMRSTIFVPFDKLGLIIVDREHSSLYKEERAPRYNARDVALKRAELENIPIILSSETPSIESYRNVLKKNYLEVDLISNGKDEILLKNRIIDMTKEKSKKKIISYELQQAILKSLKRKNQIVLFLNKRGFSSFVICSQCGYIPKCSDCNIPLSYHLNIQKKAQLVCHNCGKKMKVTDICGKCGSKDVRPLGMGTQKLESEIKKMFPRAKIKRLDRDSLIKKNDYRQTLEDFKRGDIDILIGTQMVIKGADFNNVDLIGIISADTLLNLPDYRSGEKTFQLLSEVISSFREISSPKEVIIQTFNPDHHCIIALKEQDYNYFYQKEIELRDELDYPPFAHIIRIEIKGEERDIVKQKAKNLIDYLNSIHKVKEAPEFKLLGAENMVLWKSKNNFKVQFIIKVKDLEKFNQVFKKNLDKILLNYFDKENRLIIDVDPVKML
ncbi:MAG: primosomal protein N' [Candidatus Atribacteria bacterium]